MLYNFQLGAIVKLGVSKILYRIPLHRALQNKLCVEWETQYNDFFHNCTIHSFEASYNLESNERFKIETYELPEYLQNESSASIHTLDSISETEDALESIVGIVAFAKDDDDNEIMMFQNFNRSHIIRPTFSLFQRNDTYNSIDNPGLTLDTKLAAVYNPINSELVFRSFRITNTFLPLMDFYKEASNTDILNILSHEKFAPENINAFNTSSQWFRRRFALLADSRILEEYTVEEIIVHSSDYEVTIEIHEEKIIFPEDKTHAKRLLQFLNEEIFKGAITDKLYETNSKRGSDNE